MTNTYEEALKTISFLSSASFSGKQYYFAKLLTNGQIALNTTTGSKYAIGVVQDTPVTGDPAVVAIAGVTKVILGEVVTAGEPVVANGDGSAVHPKESGDWTQGTILSSGNTGDIVPMLINRFGASTAGLDA